MAVVARAVELGGREVRSGIDRHGRDDAVTWPQQQDRGLRDNEGSNHGHGNPAGAFHVRKECPTAQAGREIHAGRHRLRHPRQPPRLRGGARRRAQEPGRGDLVPGRRGRLRRRSQRLLPARARARRRLPGRKPRPGGHRRPRPRRVLHRCRARRALDAGGHRRPSSRLAGVADARAIGGRRGALSRLAARSGLGVRPLRPAGRALPRRPARAPVAGRPLPRGALVRAPGGPARHRSGAQGRRGGGRLRRASGSSTRAASASPATATRARPGSCSTPAPGPPTGSARRTTSPAPRPRSAPRACPTRWPSAWSTASEAAPAAGRRRARAGRGHRGARGLRWRRADPGWRRVEPRRAR